MTEGPSEKKIRIATEGDVVLARQTGRALANQLGFTDSDPMFIATAISEIARNIIVHAGAGEIAFRIVSNGDKVGLEVVATDSGPGIADVSLAMKEGYSTVNSLGLGLPGARRLMDEFDIRSSAGQGTTVTMKKWTRKSAARVRNHSLG